MMKALQAAYMLVWWWIGLVIALTIVFGSSNRLFFFTIDGQEHHFCFSNKEQCDAAIRQKP